MHNSLLGFLERAKKKFHLIFFKGLDFDNLKIVAKSLNKKNADAT